MTDILIYFRFKVKLSYLKRPQFASDETTNITMKELNVIFLVWSYCIIFCTTIFILEIFYYNLKYRHKDTKLKDWLKYIFSNCSSNNFHQE